MVDVSLLSVFLIGLLGGLHCAGMCGGIVGAMSMAPRRVGKPVPIPVRNGGGGAATVMPAGAMALRSGLTLVLGYNVGRITSYTVAGAAAGAVGSTAFIAQRLLPVEQVAFVITNTILIVLGLYLLGVVRSFGPLEAIGQRLWRRLQPLAGRLLHADGFGGAFAAGVVWGWVPCGMVYGVLIAAMASGSATDGALLAAAFGLGTLPSLVALGLSLRSLRGWLQNRWVRTASGALVIWFGIAGLARIDPFDHLHQAVDACLSIVR